MVGVADIVDGDGYPPAVLRYALLAGHYRRELNFSARALDDARAALRRIADFAERVERTPVDDPNLRAGFLNISLETNRSDLLRAVFEGVAFNTRWLARAVDRFLGSPVTSLAIMGLPFVDMLLAVFRRTRAGQLPWKPDRGHLHHRMLDIGHSHRRAVILLYLWAGLIAVGRFANAPLPRALPGLGEQRPRCVRRAT